ncbi:MAG: GNAT family N-acetyltransferase [Chloroflexota bacterium]
MTDSPHQAIPTSEYTFEQLADIYNSAREDYIVPMPMNARRMKEYVQTYDVNLDASYVAVDKEDGEVNGICMLGVRDDTTWITRLGVIPVRRRKRAGLYLMEIEIEASRQLNKKYVQLEVIKGNEPAQRLFKKLGFEITRELLVIRRPPEPVEQSLIPHMQIEPITGDDVFSALEEREKGVAWKEQTASLRNAGNMQGLWVTLDDGQAGWVVYQKSAFQLSHFVIQPNISKEMIHALICAVHLTHAQQDTKIENVPPTHPTWDIFQHFGYFIAFSRLEMILTL